MRRGMLTVLFALLTAKAFARDAEKAPPASTEDCAVLAQVGHGKLQWGANPPSMMMWRSSFGTDCDWLAQGMAAPTLSPVDTGPYYEGLRFSFSNLIYSADRLQATVTLSIGGNAGPAKYFFTGDTCQAQKQDAHWHFVSCQMRFIT